MDSTRLANDLILLQHRFGLTQSKEKEWTNLIDHLRRCE